MGDARTGGSRRTFAIVISIVVGVASIAAVAIAWSTLRDGGRSRESVGAGALARSRLAASNGRAYIGTIGDVTDAVRLRRKLRAEFRSDAPRRRDEGSPTRSRMCADDLEDASGNGNGRVVLLADATLSGEPAVVVGITDRGRVVVFVADAETCEVRTAQSL